MMFFAVALAAAQLSTAQCSQAPEGPMLCPARLPAVRALVVEANAQQAWRETAPPVSCRGFVVRAAAMRRYLARAQRTDAASVHYTLAESPCYATGRVRFADGRAARWRVDQFGVGALVFAGGEKLVLFYPNLRMKPFIGQ